MGLYKMARRSFRKRRKFSKRKFSRKLRVPRGLKTSTIGTTVPDRLRCKLKYFEQKPFNIALGGNQYYTIRANSFFDPDFSLGGGQPVGYDQWAAFYNYYRVKACKIKMTVVQNGATAGNLCQLVLLPTTDTSGTTINTVTVNAQQPYAQTRFTNVNDGGGAIVHLKGYMSTAKIWGQTPAAIQADDDFSATTAANPIKEWYWVLGSLALDGVSTQSGFLDVQITMYGEFFGRKPLAGS